MGRQFNFSIMIKYFSLEIMTTAQKLTGREFHKGHIQ